MKYCQGQGLDIGCGVSKIRSDSIGIDLMSPLADMNIDARNLSDFPSGHFDYIFSGHLLEEIEDTENILREWIRVLKPDGYLVLYQADREYYYPIGHELCNKKHKHHFLWEDLWGIFEKIGGMKLIHHARHSLQENEWSFDLVVQKTENKTKEMEENVEGISILVPTFKRPENIENFTLSVDGTTSDPRNIEIVFGVHEEDKESIKKIKELKTKIEIRYKLILNHPEGVHLAYLWNQVYEKAKYQILGYFGDDVLFRTPGWDREIRKEFAKDRIVMVSCNDVHVKKGSTATLFFTHKTVHEKVGFYLNPKYRRWYTDTFWNDVFRKAGKIHYREDIVMEHLAPDVFKEKRDEIYNRMEKFKKSDQIIWCTPESQKEIETISQIVKNLA